MTRTQITRACYAGVFCCIAAVAASAGPMKPAKMAESSSGIPCSNGICLGAIISPPSRVTLHAPVTLTIESGEITLEGGSIAVTPEGQGFSGGTITIVNGSVGISAPKKEKAHD